MNTSTTPNVAYQYADGSSNTIRPTKLVYPNGRELHYHYGSANGMDDASSRVASLIDDDGILHLVDYSYLGRGGSARSVNVPFGSGFVIADSPQPEVKWTMVDLSNTNDPDTGDIYSGFDRFGRIKDNRWYGYDALADIDRIKYGYNRAGNRIWRKNVVADALGKHFDELYGNDAIQRLKDLQRGTLNGGKTEVTDESFAECWSLDPTGNWKKYLQDEDGSGWSLNQSRTANTVNEITGISASTGPTWVTPAYSRVGNMITMPQSTDPTESFTATYDAWNRLVKLVDDSTTHTIATYQYDGVKRRVVEQTYASGTLEETHHCYFTEPSKWQVIEERFNSSMSAEKQFVWGLRYIDDIVLRDRDTTNNGTLDERLYGLQDANWNITCLIDSSGLVQERYAYSAYGQPIFLNSSFTSQNLSTFRWKILFAGYSWDEASNLFDVRNRLLHSELGKWIQRDPSDYIDSPHLYQYALLDPLGITDPSGEALPPVWAVGCTACAICIGPGAIACRWAEDYLDCLQIYYDILPDWHKLACEAACTACLFKGATPKPKPVPKPVPKPKPKPKPSRKCPEGLTCEEHFVACLGTKVANIEGGVYGASRCLDCRDACKRNQDVWPGRFMRFDKWLECNYWHPKYGSNWPSK